MRKILIFSTAYLPFVGGAEVAIKEITDRIGDIQDIQFDMITARIDKKLPKFEQISKVNVRRVGIGWPMFDKYLLAFWGHKYAPRLYKEKNYDAVWSIMASYGGFAAIFFKKRNPSVKFLLTLQEGDDPGYIKKRVGLLKNKFKEIFSKADYITCISNYLAKWAKDNGAKCKIEIVPNGVDLERFSIEDLRFSFKDFKEKLRIKEDEKVIITTSRLVKKNGIDDLIKAMPKLQASNYKLLILGTGEDEKKLKNLAKELKIEDKVLFLGQVDHDDLPKYLWISDVFCRPSLSEGLGNSFLEAMAAGIPVIGTPVGGIPDFLRDGETGLFCEVNNPKSIADKVMEYINNPSRTDKIVENAQKLVKEKFNWDNISIKYNKIFNNL